MTLRQPNIDRLLQLGLSGMAEALDEQRDIADVDQLGFDDCLAMMIEREAEHRDHKSYLGYLRQAQLRIRADVQDVDRRAGRGIARSHAHPTRRRRLDPPGPQSDPGRANGVGKDVRRLRARSPSLPPAPVPSSIAACPSWSLPSSALATKAPSSA